MGHYYFSKQLADGATLCLAPLTNDQLERSGQEVADPSGYFLYERAGDGQASRVEILAQVFSQEGLDRLRQVFGLE